MFIIHDSTPERDLVEPSGMSRGLDLSARPEGFGAYAGVAEPFPDSLLVPDSDVQGMIEEQEERGTNLLALERLHGMRVKNQQRTNYCWAFGPVRALELVRLKAGLPPVSLSPASVAAPVTGFRNVGGWGLRALERLVSHGAAPSSGWPDTAISRGYDTETNRQLALDYRVTEWWELNQRNPRQLLSCVLRGIPAAVGYNRWRHEVCAIGATWRDGGPALLIDNSWGDDWGDEGRAEMQGWGLYADDAVAPRVAIAS